MLTVSDIFFIDRDGKPKDFSKPYFKLGQPEWGTNWQTDLESGAVIKFTTRRKMELNVNEIQITFSGEVGAVAQGTPIILLRLQGCNLDCSWCDAPSSKSNIISHGSKIDTRILAQFIAQSNYPLMITGGEPLIQEDEIIDMLARAVNYGFDKKVQIETNGTYYVNKPLSDMCCIVMDYKMDRMEAGSVDISFFESLTSKDWIKILVSEEYHITDLENVLLRLSSKLGENFPRIAVASVDGKYISEICNYILDKRLPLVVNIQVHKHLQVK